MIYAYLLSITAANLIIQHAGPQATIVTAFIFIGLDLVLRDKLHGKISSLKMFAMIAAAGLITLAINAAAWQIAVASSLSFAVASIADWCVFARSGGSWSVRSYKSNLIGGIVDSVMFPTLAFGTIMPGIMIGQVAAKFFGGVVWVRLIGENK